jgi:hypothetical protein
MEKEEKPEFIPRVDMALEGGRYFYNWPGYAWRGRRRIHVDILKLRKNVLFLEYEDENILGSRTANDDNIQKIRHEIAYLGLRQERDNYSLSYFYRHICHNRVERTTGKFMLWDVIEARWETKGMRLGYKNEGIDFDAGQDFELLNKFNGMAGLGIVTTHEHCRYAAVGEGGVRYDILRYKRSVPYVQGKLYATIGPKVNPNLTLETGTRFHLRHFDLSPFIEYEHQYDAERREGPVGNLLFTGLRLETHTDELISAFGNRNSFLPALHAGGYYARVLGSDNFHYDSDLAFNLDLYQKDRLTAFFNTGLTLNTTTENMKPHFIGYALEPGIAIDTNQKDLDFFFRHWERHNGNVGGDDPLDGITERYNLIGTRFQSRGMKLGYSNEGIDFDSGQDFEYLRKIDWQVSAGGYFERACYDYDWEAGVKARWDILRYKRKVPYLLAGCSVLAGDNTDGDYSMEAGVRFCGKKGNAKLFTQHRRRENASRFGGYEAKQTMLGLGFAF